MLIGCRSLLALQASFAAASTPYGRCEMRHTDLPIMRSNIMKTSPNAVLVDITSLDCSCAMSLRSRVLSGTVDILACQQVMTAHS